MSNSNLGFKNNLLQGVWLYPHTAVDLPPRSNLFGAFLLLESHLSIAKLYTQNCNLVLNFPLNKVKNSVQIKSIPKNTQPYKSQLLNQLKIHLWKGRAKNLFNSSM